MWRSGVVSSTLLRRRLEETTSIQDTKRRTLQHQRQPVHALYFSIPVQRRQSWMRPPRTGKPIMLKARITSQSYIFKSRSCIETIQLSSWYLCSNLFLSQDLLLKACTRLFRPTLQVKDALLCSGAHVLPSRALVLFPTLNATYETKCKYIGGKNVNCVSQNSSPACAKTSAKQKYPIFERYTPTELCLFKYCPSFLNAKTDEVIEHALPAF